MNDPTLHAILTQQLHDTEVYAREADDYAALCEVGDRRIGLWLQQSVMSWDLSDKIRECLS